VAGVSYEGRGVEGVCSVVMVGVRGGEWIAGWREAVQAMALQAQWPVRGSNSGAAVAAIAWSIQVSC
jgi:hypothetical protein